MFGTVLKLLLLKDLKTTFRQKKLFITEIILLFIIVPGFIALNVWAANGMDKKVKLLEEQAAATILNSKPGFLNKVGNVSYCKENREFAKGSLPAKDVNIVYSSKINETDISNFEKNFLKWHCSFKESETPDITINITTLSSNTSFEYKLILHDYNNIWHNEPHMVPDIFGNPAKNFTFSENENALYAQQCINEAFAMYSYDDTSLFCVPLYFEKIPEHPKLMILETVVKFLELLLPILISFPTLFTAHKLCEEKENNIHTFMVVMGLDRSLFVLSHLFFALFKMYLYVFPIGITVAVCFDAKIGWLMFLLLFLYSHVLIGHVFLVSSLSKKTTVIVFSSLGILLFCYILTLPSTLPFSIFDITGTSILSFLIPQMAFKTGLSHLVKADAYDESINFFAMPFYTPLCVPVFALLFQAIFLLLLAFYFDAVIPIDDSPKKHPLFFIGKKYDNVSESIKETEMQSLIDETSRQQNNMEYFENDKDEKQADIDVFHLSKKWTKNRFGVQDITFKAYQNQVTALLGHNGAGKSTTFSLLSGLTKATSGKAYVCGQEPRTLSDNPNVGFCPQWDPLFPHLTIREHLSFYQLLKGVDDPNEIEEMIQKLGLRDFLGYRAKDLNTGMRRKLCVGMAMIGNSKVIILDEPTHGMDTLSRKQLVEIIRSAKSDHTVLLATHYMDEADAVSDRIIILSNGRIICNGSSNFLKSKVGTGFLLTVDFTNAIGPESFQEFAGAALAFVQVHCKEAKIHGHVCQQFSIFLPKGSQKLFPSIFTDLETQKDGLQIASFDIHASTLEQVFIKITDEAESNVSRSANEIVQEFNQKRAESESCFKLFISQIFGLLLRKLHYTRRHYIRSAIPYLFVLVFVGIFLFTIYGPKTTLWQKDESTLSKDCPNVTVFAPMVDGRSNARVKFINRTSYEILKDSKTLVYFEKFPLAFGIEVSNKEGAAKIWYRNGFPNGIPIATSLFLNAVYFPNSTNNEIIKASISIQNEVEQPFASEYSLLSKICFAMLFPTLFVIPMFLHVEEIGHGIVHLYQRTQMSLFTYWFASFIFDLIYAFIPILLEVILIVSMDKGVILIENLEGFIISGIFLIPFIFMLQSYVTSLFFKSSTMAVIVFLVYNVLFPIVCSVVLEFFELTLYLPHTSIFFPLMLLLLMFITPYSDNLYGVCMMDLLTRENSCLGSFYLILFGNILFYATILLIWNLRRHICSCQGTPADLTPYKENADVLEEKQKVESLGPDAFQIYTLNLRKTYSGLVAVRDITMGVATNECFGLLGANGAGKSTFFNMLTATMNPTCGEGYVGGVDIRKQPLFGFCPQVSRLVPELSVAETLQFFARLKGVILKNEFLAIICEGFYLNDIKDTRVGNVSGGELRRLNIAIALITSSEILMLDEPTTGIDPRTRRHIWELLIALRTAGSSQLLTSHSMEESEALCTKIGFINHGMFIGMGTSQHLKNRFGNNHRLTIALNEPSEFLAEKLNYEFHVIFDATPISVSGNVADLVWSIPKSTEPLSQLYTRLIQFVEAQPKLENGENPIKDFAIVGTSLEEIFATMVDTKIQYEFRF